jgi:hypothetical protein
MEIILNPKYKALHHFLEHIEENFESGQIVQQSFNEIRLLQAEGLTLNVKRYGHNLSRRLKFYKMAKGKRAFIGQRLLRERGYESPEPVAFVRYRKRMITSSTYFVTVQSDLRYTLSDLSQFTEAEQRQILLAFAAYTKRLHEDGFIHHNYKDKHVLFDRDDATGWRFALIDVNRVHRHRHSINIERGLKGFERLLITPAQLDLLVREYARLRGYDIEVAVRLATNANTSYREKVSRRGR